MLPAVTAALWMLLLSYTTISLGVGSNLVPTDHSRDFL